MSAIVYLSEQRKTTSENKNTSAKRNNASNQLEALQTRGIFVWPFGHSMNKYVQVLSRHVRAILLIESKRCFLGWDINIGCWWLLIIHDTGNHEGVARGFSLFPPIEDLLLSQFDPLPCLQSSILMLLVSFSWLSSSRTTSRLQPSPFTPLIALFPLSRQPNKSW